MKLAILISLVGLLGCDFRDPPDISRKIIEHDRDRDGKPDVRVESVQRGAQLAMVIWSRPSATGSWQVTSRGLYAGSALVAVEADEDNDGFLETLVTYGSSSNDLQAFTRQRYGGVQPVSAGELEAYRKQYTAIEEFWSTPHRPESLTEAIRDTQEKIKNAEEQKRFDGARLEK